MEDALTVPSLFASIVTIDESKQTDAWCKPGRAMSQRIHRVKTALKADHRHSEHLMIVSHLKIRAIIIFTSEKNIQIKN